MRAGDRAGVSEPVNTQFGFPRVVLKPLLGVSWLLFQASRILGSYHCFGKRMFVYKL